MKNTLIAAVAGTILALSSVQSQADSYFGASFGSADQDTGLAVGQSGVTSLDEKDSGFKIFYGFEVSSNVDVELHYADFGEITATDGTTSVKAESNSFGVSGVYNFIEEGSFSPFVKLGVHRWSGDATASNGALSASGSDDGFDVNYGIGADINLSESFAIRAEYEMYKLDNLDTTLLSIGAKFTF